MRKLLHVVNISFVLPYYIGEQFAHFEKLGYRFYVACTHSEHLLNYAEEKKFIPFPIPILRSINPFQDIKSILALRRFIKENKIDIVFGHTPKGALIGMAAGYLSGVKSRIYFRHGLMYETTSGFKRFMLKTIERITSNMATDIVCVSQSVIEKSNKEKLNKPEKNILLNKGTCNGIDSIRFSLASVSALKKQELFQKYNIDVNSKVIGYVGRLVNDKGINELIEAWKILLKEVKNIKLLLIGPFEDRDALSMEVKDYIINEPSIIFAGLIEDVQPFYSLMDIFILPSYREGFPTVILEASSMEVPVITTRSTGCVDSIIENFTGKYTDIDPIDIAKNIQSYLSDEHMAKQHGLNGRQFVLDNFNQQIIWKEIENKFLN